MSLFTYNGQEYEQDDTWSNKDCTGWSLVNEKLDGLVINNSCFSQETPDTNVFPHKMKGVTFIDCNLDNCIIPTGNTVIGGTQKRFEVQTDGEDWHVDENNEPVEPLNKKQYLMLGLSIDPADLPEAPKEKSIVLEYHEEKAKFIEEQAKEAEQAALAEFSFTPKEKAITPTT